MAEKRAYRSPLRQRQADETRGRIVAAALDLFGQHGYALTTLRAIADRAGVSLETVQAHGPKAALLRAAIELAGFGREGLDDVVDQERARVLFALDKDEVPAAVGALLLAIHEPASAVYRALLGGVGNDPALADHLEEIVRSIRRQWTAVFEVGVERGWLRPEKGSLSTIVDAWCWKASPDAYLRLVGDYGWTGEQYAVWLAGEFAALMGMRR